MVYLWLLSVAEGLFWCGNGCVGVDLDGERESLGVVTLSVTEGSNNERGG